MSALCLWSQARVFSTRHSQSGGDGVRLKDKVAIVTGGAQGIGRGVVRRFAAEGASVLLVDLDVDRGTAAAAEVQGEGHQATFIQCDVSRADAVAGLFSRVQTEFGGIDILVNNAGLAHGPGAERHFLDMDEQMWDRVMATNLKSVYLCSWHAATMMKTRGRGGSIVNISSGGATRAHRHRVAYDASKRWDRGGHARDGPGSGAMGNSGQRHRPRGHSGGAEESGGRGESDRTRGCCPPRPAGYTGRRCGCCGLPGLRGRRVSHRDRHPGGRAACSRSCGLRR